MFGAFDRHNFGDLLFAHVAEALLAPRRLHFAGLIARDMRAVGGHALEALQVLGARLGAQPVNLLHAGGEVLTCTDEEAAVMLLEPSAAQALLSRGRTRVPLPFAAARLPYIASPGQFPHVRMLFNAVGGVALDRLDPPLREEAAAALRTAAWLGVRDWRTQAALRTAGIAARLLPDPATMVPALFAARIARHAAQGEVAAVRDVFPRGYLAVQFSSDFGDDATLSLLASQLDEAAAAHRLGIALFRAGAAPWHDDLDVLARLHARMRCPVHVFESLDIWDICALIGASVGFAGSSLHGRIVAAAFGLSRVSCTRLWPVPGKQDAYAHTWDTEWPACTGPAALAAAIAAALAVPAEARRQHAQAMQARYLAAFRDLAAALM
ncbi:MAG TPA: polysaccharide pyruvyl transferase family protein [Noviherbaspirillum sp.]|nr:polysaccharide pyruvyl transferase family protein [Noviherbaspirillum sp.]